MEELARGVGREGDELLGRVPRRIDAGADGVLALEIDLRDFAVVDEDSAAVGHADVEEHVVGVVVLIAVAVYALAFLVVARHLIVEHLRFLEVGEVALGDLHVFVDDV